MYGVIQSDKRLNSVLALWPDWSDCRPHVMSRIDSGKTNDSYLLSVDDRKFVLRLNASNSNKLGIDRYAELNILSAAASASIAPQVIYHNVREGVLITEYISDSSWSETHLHNAENIHQLAAILKSIHSLSVNNSYVLDIESRLNLYLGEVTDRQLQKKLLRYHRDVIRLLDSNDSNQKVLCHNDCLVSNMLIDSQKNLKIIDWEYAAIGNPLFDFAVIIEGQLFPENMIDVLLGAYFKCSDRQLSRYREGLLVQRMIYSYLDMVWHAVQVNKNSHQEKVVLIDEQLLKLKRWFS